MNIKRTLLISSASIGEELISKLQNELLLSNEGEYADLLMRKVALVKVDKDLGVSSSRPDSKIDLEKPADFWNIPDIWKAYCEKEKEIEALIRKAINAVSSGEDDLKLSMIEKTIIDPNINILVILPVYKPAESVFLPFIIEKVFFKLGIPGYNYHIIGLLPCLDDGEVNEKYLPRAYACISECEKILSQKQDLLNSFALLSAQNERNIHMGKLKEILPTLEEYLNMSFFNHQTIADVRTSYLSFYRDKPAFFSSWGFTTYVFKRDRFEKHFENRLTIKSIDEFFEAYNEPVERDLFFTEVGQLVGELKWSDKNKLLEDAEGYVPFSKSKKLSAQSFKGKKKDETKNILEEARKNHEETHEGYYRNNYLVSLSKNMAEQTRESQRIIAKKIKTYLDHGLNGVKKAYALTFALLGKDESGIFTGKAAIDPVSLRSARDQIAEFYKQYLPEEERISLNDIRAKERAIKTKQEESDRLLRKIENLEVKLFGKTEELSEIEEIEDKLFFTIDGQKVHISGARDMDGPIPDSIKSYEPTVSGSLPKIVDLRPFMTPVEDQQQVGSCTANALVGAYEYLIKRGTQKIKDFSRLFVYYNGREKGGYANEDKGSAICYCTESMMEKGVCLESTWDYLPDKVTEKPTPKAYKEAANYKVIVAEHFDNELELMKRCLAEGFPFVFGLKLYKSFQNATEKGIVPIPEANEVSLDKHGLHAMLCVGYSDEEKCFIVRNSWGQHWGDKGYCYIPYQYLADKNHRSTESNFLLKTISDVEINEKEIVKNIAKDSGSLFNFSYDIHDLNAYKDNREKLKAEIDNLHPELEELREEFTRQREKVLMEDFRGEAEEMEVGGIKKEQQEVLKEICEVEEKLEHLQKEKQKLIDKSKRLKIKLLLIYPALGLIALILAAGVPVLIWSWFNVVRFLLSHLTPVITIGSIGLVVYVVWALLKYKREAIDKLNTLQDEINLQSDKRNDLLTRLIGLYDKYFEIRRNHKLFDVYYNFIMAVREHVEYLREYFDKWADRLESQKNELKKELPEKEFVDTNIVFHAISENNLAALIDKQDVKQDYYQNGSRPMTDFFMNNKNEFVDASVGVKSFNEDLISSSRKNHIFQQIKSFGIFDFLFDNEMLLEIFPGLRKRPLDEKLDVYSQFCRPFIRVNATTDAISPHQLFELQLPKDDTENCRTFIDQAKKKFGGKVSEYDNRNDRSSGIVFFSVISLLPAYVLEPVQSGFHSFRKMNKEGQTKIHIKDFGFFSCIPDEIKDNI